MGNIRRAVVAGSFYSADPNRLQKSVDGFLLQASVKTYKDILGVIAPHAGYAYSGQCAAYSYNAIKNKDFDLAVIIAPSHQHGDFYYSVGDFDAYQTPLGQVQVSKEYTEKLLSNSKFVFYPYAHNNEHSLEVQLPFLQRIKPNAAIVPILIGYQYDLSSEYLANYLKEIFADRLDKTVFIISSDLSHYHSYDEAVKFDNALAEAIENMFTDTVFQLIRTKKAEACGYGGIMTMMNLAEIFGYNKVDRLNYVNSGDVSGDKNKVVGYLASAFYR